MSIVIKIFDFTLILLKISNMFDLIFIGILYHLCEKVIFYESFKFISLYNLLQIFCYFDTCKIHVHVKWLRNTNYLLISLLFTFYIITYIK